MALFLKWLVVTSSIRRRWVPVLLVGLLVVVHTSCSDSVMDLKLNYFHLKYDNTNLVAAGNGAWEGQEIIISQAKKFQEITSVPRGTICPFTTCLFSILSSLNYSYAILGTHSRMKKICSWL